MTAPLLLSIFPSFAIGGAQSRFTTIANHFGPTWRHAVVAMDGVTAARERLQPGLDVTFPAVEVRKGDLLGNVRRFRAALKALRPAAMLTHNFGSIEWAMANRRRIVRHVHVEDGFGPEERQHQIPRRVWLRRLFLRQRTVVVPSRTLLRIAAETWRLDTRHVHFVPNGIDLDRFGRVGPAHPWPGAGPVIGTIAALRPEKNVARLIRAFRLVTERSPARLVLIGDGPQRAELQALAKSLGLNGAVHFEGHVGAPDDMLRSFDIFALSSDTEQMPLSLLEAMAAARPIAATDVGDVADMLPPVGRPFVTACDDTALAEALLRLVRNAALRDELGQTNQAKARAEFDQADMFARWSALLGGKDQAASVAR